MKKYAFILLGLILLGAVLIWLFLNQDERLDQGVFLSTTESIRNLQALDKNLLIQLHASAYAQNFNSDSLLDIHYEVSEEFDNLRYDALFEEIEGSASLSQAVEAFDDNFAQRESALEEYIEINERVTSNIAAVSTYSKDVAAFDWDDEAQSVLGIIAQVDAEIAALPIGSDIADPAGLRRAVASLPLDQGNGSAELVDDYRSTVISVLNDYPLRNETFQRLLDLNTGPLLDAVESEYVGYHNQAIGESNTFRNALIGYGFLLFLSLLFFGLQIRRNYLSLEQQVADRTAEIQTAYQDLKESQEQLIQSEKMASLGQMVAGVAHEINTPLGYVASNLETVAVNLADVDEVMREVDRLYQLVVASDRDKGQVSRQLAETLKAYRRLEADVLVEEATQLLNDGEFGLGEISTLVRSLKDFARLDRQSFEQIDVHDCIENALTIGSNQLRENSVQVNRNYGQLPRINCIPSKLNQLFLNILSNACYAMREKGGEFDITTRANEELIELSFRDQGTGMSVEAMQKVFDPFFTTKEIGAGTGLGMSIAYKIVQSHGGDISVNSKLNEGTTFVVTLPITGAGSVDAE